MQNSVLFRRSSFFVDAINVIFYTDLFLYHELLERMKQNEFLRFIFGDKLQTFQTENRGELDKLIIKYTVTKKNQNILLDWISLEKYKESDIDISVEEYVSMLYGDMLTNPICEEYMQTTEFGNTLKLLSKDRQLNRLHIYIPLDSELLKQSINESFSNISGNSSLSIIVGGKEEYLKSHSYDSYVFENISDVDEFLAIEGKKVVGTPQTIKEVLIPTYEFNMEEGRTDLDILIEQVTYHKLKLKKTANEYQSDYNLSINTISVPI